MLSVNAYNINAIKSDSRIDDHVMAVSVFSKHFYYELTILETNEETRAEAKAMRQAAENYMAASILSVAGIDGGARKLSVRTVRAADDLYSAIAEIEWRKTGVAEDKALWISCLLHVMLQDDGAAAYEISVKKYPERESVYSGVHYGSTKFLEDMEENIGKMVDWDTKCQINRRLETLFHDAIDTLVVLVRKLKKLEQNSSQRKIKKISETQ